MLRKVIYYVLVLGTGAFFSVSSMVPPYPYFAKPGTHLASKMLNLLIKPKPVVIPPFTPSLAAQALVSVVTTNQDVEKLPAELKRLAALLTVLLPHVQADPLLFGDAGDRDVEIIMHEPVLFEALAALLEGPQRSTFIGRIARAAAHQGNIGMLLFLAQRGVPLSLIASNQLSDQLGAAAERGDLVLVSFLIGHGADIESRNELGQTPLYRAAVRGHIEIVRYLLEHGAQAQGADYQGVTLEQAIEHSRFITNESGRRELLELVMSPEQKKKNKQLILEAAFGNYGAVQNLVEHEEADVNARDEHGDTPLIVAARNGQRPVVIFLLEHGADSALTNEQGKNAYAAALHMGHADIARQIEHTRARQTGRGIHAPSAALLSLPFQKD
jgi:hypothetical protein